MDIAKALYDALRLCVGVYTHLRALVTVGRKVRQSASIMSSSESSQ